MAGINLNQSAGKEKDTESEEVGLQITDPKRRRVNEPIIIT